MNQILYSKKASKKPIVIALILILVLITIIMCFGFGIINKFNNKILKGVIAANVALSDMTVEEAEEAINLHYRNSEIEKEIIIKYEGFGIEVSTKDIGYGYTDAQELAKQAYAYGRDENIIKNNFTVLNSYFNTEKIIESEEKIDKDKLERTVSALVSGESAFLQDDSYDISGDKLILTKGTQGKKIDYDALAEKVLVALKNREVEVEIPVIISEPESLDMDKLHEQICRKPQNASVNGNNIIKEKDGLDFDLEDAKSKYYSLKDGESVEVQLTITEPEIKVSDLGDELFKNLIATYQTKYDTSDTNRVTNLELAANKCNEKVLYVDEEFSFNQMLGSRTEANGYKPSNSYAGGQVVQSVGGGICQVSSTLYNAVLRADLEVTSRTAHAMAVKYVSPSTDATVADDAIDFKFKNNTQYPIKIVTTCKDGICVASIYGYKDLNGQTIDIVTDIIEEKPYAKTTINDSNLPVGTTEIVQSPLPGYVSKAYKVYYKNGKEVSRKLISEDTYEPINEITKVGTKVDNGNGNGNSNGGQTVTNHTYVASSKWSSDNNSHWHPCAYPGCKMSHTSAKISHNYSAWKSNGASGHIRTCQQCGRTQEVAHNFGNWMRGTVENTRKRVCADCYYEEVSSYSTDPWYTPENPDYTGNGNGNNNSSNTGLPEGWDSPLSGY